MRLGKPGNETIGCALLYTHVCHCSVPDTLYRREVVNFDVDLMDCTVLACALAAYCPFLVRPDRTL